MGVCKAARSVKESVAHRHCVRAPAAVGSARFDVPLQAPRRAVLRRVTAREIAAGPGAAGLYNPAPFKDPGVSRCPPGNRLPRLQSPRRLFLRPPRRPPDPHPAQRSRRSLRHASPPSRAAPPRPAAPRPVRARPDCNREQARHAGSAGHRRGRRRAAVQPPFRPAQRQAVRRAQGRGVHEQGAARSLPSHPRQLEAGPDAGSRPHRCCI